MRAMDVGTTGAGAETHLRLGTGAPIATIVGIIRGGTVAQEAITGGTQTVAGGIAGTVAAVGPVGRMDGATIGDTLAGDATNRQDELLVYLVYVRGQLVCGRTVRSQTSTNHTKSRGFCRTLSRRLRGRGHS